MKKGYVLFLGLAIAIFSVSCVQAQLTKQEAKQWKTSYKAYKKDLESFKALVEEHGEMKGKLSAANGQLASLQSELGDKDDLITQAQGRIRQIEGDVASAKAAQRRAEVELANAAATPASTETGSKTIAGVVFKVQIGAFRNKDLSKYFENNENFGGETDGDGTQKITLGVFKDYWEADTFKKYLREMGVNDAWIVSYKDGTRVPLKDVLEGVI